MIKNILISVTAMLIAVVLSSAASALSFDISSVRPQSLNPGIFNPGQWTGAFPVDPDQYGERGLRAAVYCNTGRPWHIYIRTSRPLTNTSASNKTIPNPNFQWWGWTVAGEAGTGINNRNNGGTYNYLDQSNWAVYNSVARDQGTPGQQYVITKIHLQFGIAVPTDARAGTYNTEVELTLVSD